MLVWVMVEMSGGSGGTEIRVRVSLRVGVVALIAQPLSLSWSRSVWEDREGPP